MSENPADGPLLVNDPPVRGRDTFGSPGGSVARTFCWFEAGCTWGTKRIGSSNSKRQARQAPTEVTMLITPRVGGCTTVTAPPQALIRGHPGVGLDLSVRNHGADTGISRSSRASAPRGSSPLAALFPQPSYPSARFGSTSGAVGGAGPCAALR